MELYPRVFVVNLKSSEDRRHKIEKLLKDAGISYELFEAADGRGNRFIVDNNTTEVKISSTEYACSLSHLNIYRQMVANNNSIALILEDDIHFDDTLKNAINSLQSNSSVWKKYDLILCGYHNDNINFRKKAITMFWNRVNVSSGLFVGKPVLRYWGSYGYFISKKAAAILLSKYPEPKMPADFLLFRSFGLGVKTGIFSFPLVWPNELIVDSTIDARASLEKRDSVEPPKSQLYHSNKRIAFIKTALQKMHLLSLYNFIARAKPSSFGNSSKLFCLKTGIIKPAFEK